MTEQFWEYKLVNYHVDYHSAKEYIYVNGEEMKSRNIPSGIFRWFSSDFLSNYINDLGQNGWEIQSDIGTNESRNMVFKKQQIENKENHEDDDIKQKLEQIFEALTTLSQNVSRRDPKNIEKKLYRIVEAIEIISKNTTHALSGFLISQKGIDYNNLNRLLSIKKWKAADQETRKILLQLYSVEDSRFIPVERLSNIGNEDFLIIDYLWVKHSQGHFGYSTQKKILQELGEEIEIPDEEEPEDNEDDSYQSWEERRERERERLEREEKRFGQTVGWYDGDAQDWLTYNELNFSDEAPKGHLPKLNLDWGDVYVWQTYVEFLNRTIF